MFTTVSSRGGWGDREDIFGKGGESEWLSEDILKAYHAKKVDVIEMSDNETEDIIRNAIQKYVNKYDYADTEN